MKKKHRIKTVEDIKYCEENGLTIFSETEDRYYEFHNNVWCSYDENSEEIKVYNCEIYFDDLYLYYYEESEGKQKITEDDLMKKVIFPDGSVGELRFIVTTDGKNFMYGKDACTFYKSCELIEEQQEASEKDVGMLCWFWGRNYKDAQLGILEEVSYDDNEVKYLSKDRYWYYHCRPLTKEDIKEFMEKAE